MRANILLNIEKLRFLAFFLLKYLLRIGVFEAKKYEKYE